MFNYRRLVPCTFILQARPDSKRICEVFLRYTEAFAILFEFAHSIPLKFIGFHRTLSLLFDKAFT